MVHEVEVIGSDAMRALGERLAALLEPGVLVILNGPLGAGKTTLVQGIARGLGVTERVTSPTFVISHVHRGERALLVHVDAYRLGDPRDLAALDLDDYLERAVTVVEWGRNVFAEDAPGTHAITIQRPVGSSELAAAEQSQFQAEPRVVVLPDALAAAAEGGV